MIIIWLLLYQVSSSHCDKFRCFTTQKQGTPNSLQLYEDTLAYTFWFKYYLQANGPFRITIIREQIDRAIMRGFSYDIVIRDSTATHDINLMNYQTFWENQLQVPIQQDEGVWHFVIFSIENRYIDFKIIFNGNIYRALIIHLMNMPIFIENNIYYSKTVVVICQEEWINIKVIDAKFFENIVNCGEKRGSISIKYRIDILKYLTNYFDINYNKFRGWFRDLHKRANFSLDFYSTTQSLSSDFLKYRTFLNFKPMIGIQIYLKNIYYKQTVYQILVIGIAFHSIFQRKNSRQTPQIKNQQIPFNSLKIILMFKLPQRQMELFSSICKFKMSLLKLAPLIVTLADSINAKYVEGIELIIIASVRSE